MSVEEKVESVSFSNHHHQRGSGCNAIYQEVMGSNATSFYASNSVPLAGVALLKPVVTPGSPGICQHFEIGLQLTSEIEEQ